MFSIIYRWTLESLFGRNWVRLVTACLLLVLWFSPRLATADTITCAVASNFTSTLREIVKGFESTSGHSVRIVAGSTGKLFAQIVHGAPFDVFLAADTKRPRLLEQQNRIVPGSRFMYARGQLVLWSHDADFPGTDVSAILKSGKYQRLALANPKTAPYGLAAREVLTKFGIWESLAGKKVRGENIGQAFQFVATGNADLGLVALSQVNDPKLKAKGKYFLIPVGMYSPLAQEAVLLKGTKHLKASQEFLSYLKSSSAQNVMRRFGYLNE